MTQEKSVSGHTPPVGGCVNPLTHEELVAQDERLKDLEAFVRKVKKALRHYDATDFYIPRRFLDLAAEAKELLS